MRDADHITGYDAVTYGNHGWLIALIALRTLSRRKVRAASMISVLAVGIAALMLIASLSTSIEHTFGENVYDILSSDIIITPRSGSRDAMITDAETLITNITSSIPEVQAATPRIEAEGLMSTGVGWRNTTGSLVYGIDRERDRNVSRLQDHIEKGGYETFRSSTGGQSEGLPPVIVGTKFLKNADLRVEDGNGNIENDEQLRLTFGRLRETDGDITPIVLDFFIAATYDTHLPYFDDLTIFIPIEQCRQLLDINQFDPKANKILIKLEEKDDASNVKEDIEDLLSDGNDDENNSVRVRTHEEFREHYLNDIIATTRPVGYLIVTISLASAILRMAHTSAAAVQERIFDLGILRAIGFTRRLVMRIYLFESGMSGVLGGLSGILLGYLIILTLNRSSLTLFSLPLSELNLLPTAGFIISLIVLSVGVGVLSVAGLLLRVLRDPTVYLMKIQ